MEKELIWIFGHIPGFSATLPSVIAKLHAAKEKYLSPPSPASSSLQVEVCIFSTKRGHLSLDDLALFISFLFLLIGSLMHDKFPSTGKTMEFLFYDGLEYYSVACACELLR
jgi:hypothetical protein